MQVQFPTHKFKMEVEARRQRCNAAFHTGYTLWSQYMSELDPEDVPIVDRIAYDCLKQYGLIAS